MVLLAPVCTTKPASWKFDLKMGSNNFTARFKSGLAEKICLKINGWICEKYVLHSQNTEKYNQFFS